MMMSSRRVLIGLGCAAILCLAVTAHWYHGHEPIACHNEFISVRHCGGCTNRGIQHFSTAAPSDITNREEIAVLLDHFKFPWSTTVPE